MFCIRRNTPGRKETLKDGSHFLRRKEERRVSEDVRTMCHEAIREIGRDPVKVEKAVASHIKFWISRVSLERCEAYLQALPGVLRKILAANRN